MATHPKGKAKVGAAQKAAGKPEPQYVSKAEFARLSGEVSETTKSVNQLVDFLTKGEKGSDAAGAVRAQERAVEKAGPAKTPVNPEWEEMAKAVLGDALDHCEAFYPKSGGIIFTVVIRKEKSNAPKSYLNFYREDRRSREIGAEGLDGVEQWCKLVKQNLARKAAPTT